MPIFEYGRETRVTSFPTSKMHPSDDPRHFSSPELLEVSEYNYKHFAAASCCVCVCLTLIMTPTSRFTNQRLRVRVASRVGTLENLGHTCPLTRGCTFLRKSMLRLASYDLLQTSHNFINEFRYPPPPFPSSLTASRKS